MARSALSLSTAAPSAAAETPPATILPLAPLACIAATKSPASRLAHASLGSASKAKLLGLGFGGAETAALWP